MEKIINYLKTDLFTQCKNGIVNKVLALLSLLTSKSLNFLQRETVLSVLLAILIFIIFVRIDIKKGYVNHVIYN